MVGAVDAGSKNMVEELCSIVGFFLESSVFLTLGIVLRYSYVTGAGLSYSQAAWNLVRCAGFIGLLLVVRYLVQLCAAHSLLAKVWQKEKYTRKEMFSYVLTAKYSVFSAVIYLTSHSKSRSSTVSQYSLVVMAILAQEGLKWYVASRFGEDNKIFRKKSIYEFSLKLRVLRNTMIDTMRRWEQMRHQNWNLQVNSRNLASIAGLAEDNIRLEEILA